MPMKQQKAIVIGAGPAGLMAAEVLAATGVSVDVYDAMPSPGRKFLLAGIGGMNITHAEPFDEFVTRYRERNDVLSPLLEKFSADDLRAWIQGLSIETFVGTSGRVFPREMKAAPLLRAWLHRLRASGVRMHTRHRWQGWNETGALCFETRDGIVTVAADATILALGGGSWPRLGSDGAWLPWLQARDVQLRELLPSNCGFEIEWSEHFRSRHAGQPVKPVIINFNAGDGEQHTQRGEFIVTDAGIEGSLVYALSAPLRDEILASGNARIVLDLAPDRDEQELAAALEKPRGRKSLGEHLRRAAGIHGVKAGLLRENVKASELEDMTALARRIKSLPLLLKKTRPVEESISTAGGVLFESLNEDMMLTQMPGVFCAGEMLDWEAPTGGYLLTACFATGYAAGEGAARWLQSGT